MKTPYQSPKLVYIVTSAVSANVLLRGQLGALAADGFDVWAITSPDLDLAEIARREGVTIVPVQMEREMHPLKDGLALLHLYRALRRIRPEIVNASTPKAGLLGMIASSLAGVPFRVYQLRGLRLETISGWQRRILLAAEWIASRLAHTVVCNSASLRDTFLDLRLVDSSKVIVLGNGSSNGVDTSRFRPAAPGDEETEPLRRTLGFNRDDVVIGFVGRLTRDKGVADLLEAYDDVLSAVPRTRLLFVGRFEAGDPLPAAAVERIERDNRIVVTGFVDDTAPYYRLMNLLAFPSYREGFPNVPLEAAASALPVVGYRATGTVDAVSDGETGILVEPGDIQSLGKAICALLTNHSLAEKMAIMARQRAVSLYEAREVWQTWADFYSSNVVERVPALH